MSTLKVGTIQDTSAANGCTPSQLNHGRIKAWVSYNQATDTVNDSYNVSSVSDDATGKFTVNFTTSFANATYGFGGSCNRAGTTAEAVGKTMANSPDTYATGNCKVMTGWPGNDSLYDCEVNNAVFFGDQ